MDEFEEQLREFRPRRPAPLASGAAVRRRRATAVAVAVAALAAAIAAAVVVPSMEHVRAVPEKQAATDVPTLGALTTLALDSPERLDAALARMSRTSLPDVEQAGTALQRLAGSNR